MPSRATRDRRRRQLHVTPICDRTPLGTGQATWKLMLLDRPPPGLLVAELDRVDSARGRRLDVIEAIPETERDGEL